MKELGACLIALAGFWLGILHARDLRAALRRCAAYARMLELISLELGRFRTPLPELFLSLSDCLEGDAASVCSFTASELAVGEPFRDVWKRATEALRPEEKEILCPLAEVLGAYGAEEQAARTEQAREEMLVLWDSRRTALRDRSRVCIGLCSAGGLLLAMMLL